ncbi:MAG: CoA pyrophosphatase [Vicinamibacterales bacterium]
MSPRPERRWPPDFDRARIRHAAGLLLLYPIDAQPFVVLTVRSAAVRHSGQVSLPGGVIEPGESHEEAALREAHEEIGLASDGVRLLGRLTPIDIPVSGFRLHPIVGALDVRPPLRPSDLEVSRIIEAPLTKLLDAAPVEWSTRESNGVQHRVPSFRLDDDTVVWGATAMVIAELLALLGWTGPAPERS